MTIENWRMKSMPLTEWSALQERFANLQMATGAPADLAMFVKTRPAGSDAAIYIVGPGIGTIEAYSPGGWTNVEKPSGEGLALLVGEGDPWTYFGIPKSH